MLVRVVSSTGLIAAAVITAVTLTESALATAGPAAVGGAQGVIDMLTSEGYRVIVTKMGGRDRAGRRGLHGSLDPDANAGAAPAHERYQAGARPRSGCP
ncbi:hypothetical protein [Mycobacteroides stephanolepidis]|nr:hypothetical protein [[Mycobacterium] stephanolepidis]